MAKLIRINHREREPKIESTGAITWLDSSTSVAQMLPVICWADETPWREANLWSHECLIGGSATETVLSNIQALLTYAKWLESHGVEWTHFPDKERDRCLTRFRGFLVNERTNGNLAPSTAASRMAAVIRFYRWAHRVGLLSPNYPMWRDRTRFVSLTDSFGFNRSISVTTTNLSIPHRRLALTTPEDGLLPLSRSEWNEVRKYVALNGSPELQLLLDLGFTTGMRFGTLADLRCGTITKATPHPSMPGWFRISIGPTATPPVSTKFGRSGQVIICAKAIEALKLYMTSPRRLLRAARSPPKMSDLVFLTRSGGKYGNKSGESHGITVELSRLRTKAVRDGILSLRDFHFHRTRATFGTELARVALRHGGAKFALWLCREALMHRSELDTLRYIRFVQTTDALSEASEAFSREFFGMIGADDDVNSTP